MQLCVWPDICTGVSLGSRSVEERRNQEWVGEKLGQDAGPMTALARPKDTLELPAGVALQGCSLLG